MVLFSRVPEIYDGLSAVYDYGQNGCRTENNIKQYWWKNKWATGTRILLGLDSAILMHPTTLEDFWTHWIH